MYDDKRQVCSNQPTNNLPKSISAVALKYKKGLLTLQRENRLEMEHMEQVWLVRKWWPLVHER